MNVTMGNGLGLSRIARRASALPQEPRPFMFVREPAVGASPTCARL